jgi:hypothetical protein
MTELELVDSFFEKINNEDFASFYKFFTKDTIVYIIDEHREIPVAKLVDRLETKEYKFKFLRRFASSAAVKQETLTKDKQVDFIFDIRQRRIYRLELTTDLTF